MWKLNKQISEQNYFCSMSVFHSKLFGGINDDCRVQKHKWNGIQFWFRFESLSAERRKDATPTPNAPT